MTHKKIFTIREKMIMLLYADEADYGDCCVCLKLINKYKIYNTLIVSGIDLEDWFVFSLLLYI